MKRGIFSSMVLIVLSSTALALGPGVGFGVHGNFSNSNFPGPAITGATQLKDSYGIGYGGGVHMDVHLTVFSFRVSGDYLHFSIDQEKFRDAFRPTFGNAVSQLSIDGGGLGIYTVSVNGKMGILPLPVVSPYITGGIGLAWLSRDEIKTSIAGAPGTTIPSGTQNSKTTASVGVGVDFKLGVSLYIEAKYAWISTDVENSTYFPVTVGVTF